MMVVIEGPSASGKTTLRRALSEISDFKHMVVSTSWPGHIARAKYLDKAWTSQLDEARIFDTAVQPLYVFLDAPDGVLGMRQSILKKAAAPDPERIRKCYEQVWDLLLYPNALARLMRLNTEAIPLADAARRVLDRADELASQRTAS